MREKFLTTAFMFLLMGTPHLLEAKTLGEVASEMGLSKTEATKVLNGANVLIQNVKYKFHEIGSSNTPYGDKIGRSGLIYDTYPLFTRGRNTNIQTSSLNRPRPHSTRLSNYLKKLAYMSKQEGISVRLEFGKNMWVRDIRHVNNIIKVNIDVMQYFKRCKNRDRRQCYSDITTKTFTLNIRRNRGRYHFSVDAVRVKDTIRAESSDLIYMGIKG
jgi:hypothetical protein